MEKENQQSRGLAPSMEGTLMVIAQEAVTG